MALYNCKRNLLRSKYSRPFNGYNINKIGEGTYGIVYKLKEDEVAVKEFIVEYNIIKPDIIREVSALQSLCGNPNIIELVGLSVSDKNRSIPVMFMKYYSHTLSNIIYCEIITIDEPLIKNITFQILNGLQVMINHGFAHRDLKPSNILINIDTMELVIADFGLCRKIDVDNVRAVDNKLYNEGYTGLVQTLWYSAPELLIEREDLMVYDTSIDVWSVGTIIVELINGKPLFPGENDIDQLFKILKIMGSDSAIKAYCNNMERRPPYWSYKGIESVIKSPQPPLQLDIIQKMLKVDRRERISVREALEHDYFKSGDVIFKKSYQMTRLGALKNLIVTETNIIELDFHFNESSWEYLIEWMLNVLDKEMILEQKYIYYSVRLLVRYTNMKTYSQEDDKLIGFCCLLIVGMTFKLYENSSSFYTRILDYKYSKGRISSQITNILETLQYKIYDPNEYEYYIAIMKCKPSEKKQEELTEAFDFMFSKLYDLDSRKTPLYDIALEASKL